MGTPFGRCKARYWVVGCVLFMAVGLSAAEEGEESEDRPNTQAYDQAIIKFNFHITSFSTWAAFKAAVSSYMEPGVNGQCYELTGSAMEPVEITTVQFLGLTDDGWRKTRGNGWRRRDEDRTFVEYRLNEKARVLMRIEGVKPRFFFAYTRKVCEFPFPPMPNKIRVSLGVRLNVSSYRDRISLGLRSNVS